MAAQRDKEETNLQVTENLTLTLCVNNCGLYGNPSTNNMCESCFRSKIRPSTSSSSSAGDPAGLKKPRSDPIPSLEIARRGEDEAEEEQQKTTAREATTTRALKAVNRCLKCRKRVGLMGFRCRCGDLFCGDHRYSDRHDCGFDYKKLGRDRIQSENPIVRAAKIVRI